jgi:MFS family permease
VAEIASLPRSDSLLANRAYLLLWTGQSLSFLGDYFFAATITLWMIDQLAKGESWLPLATGGVVIAATLPSLVLGPVAGVFVDRWNRRWTMIWTDIARLILVTLFLFLVVVASNHTILLVGCVIILLLVASGSQFFLPAREATVADLVPSEHYTQAYGSLHQARYLAQILGPSLAAPLYLILGPTWAIALNAGSFGASALLILAIRRPGERMSKVQKQANFWQEFREGYLFFVRNRVLVTLLISGIIYMVGGMAYNSFEYLYGVENLHIPGQLLGIYVACYGVGVVASLPVTAALAKRVTEVEVLWIFLVSSGLVTLILSRMNTLIPGMICGFLLGVFSASVLIAVRPLTILVTPRELIGRVMAFEMPLITVASLLGGGLASILASTVLSDFHVVFAGMTFGRLDTIFVLVGLVTIGAGVFARLALYPAVKAVRAKQAGEIEGSIEGEARR